VRVEDGRSYPPNPDDPLNGTDTTDGEALTTIQRAFDLLPSPATDIAPAFAPSIKTTHAFHTDAGLIDLMWELDDIHNCDTWEWLWSGLGLTECPEDDRAEWVGVTKPFNRGMANGGNTCISAAYWYGTGYDDLDRKRRRRIKTAHELGHNVGFLHVNRGCNSDPNGLFYPHPDDGDLIDIPFDPYWNRVIGNGVGTVQDFMSYGCRRWVSGDSWMRLITAIS
jgi:hypothetical protein